MVKKSNSKTMVISSLCAFLLAGTLAGCSQPAGDGNADSPSGEQAKEQSQESSQPETLDADSHLFQLMGELREVTTVEEANQIIGSEGEKDDDQSSEESTHYYWDLGNETGIGATFFESGSSRYDADYPIKMVGPRADFSKWDDIKAKGQSKEGITYDELVELVGGVPGLKDTVSGDSITYQWYNADGNYLFAMANADTGKCSTISGRF